MSDTAVAIQAAKEVKADSLAPELYRQANEWFFLASQDYRLKNFHEARKHVEKARIFAERAEFEAIRNGAVRSETPPDPLAQEAEEPARKSSPDEYEPVSKPVFVETYESQQQQQAEQGAGGAPPEGAGTAPQEAPPL